MTTHNYKTKPCLRRTKWSTKREEKFVLSSCVVMCFCAHTEASSRRNTLAWLDKSELIWCSEILMTACTVRHRCAGDTLTICPETTFCERLLVCDSVLTRWSFAQLDLLCSCWSLHLLFWIFYSSKYCKIWKTYWTYCTLHRWYYFIPH